MELLLYLSNYSYVHKNAIAASLAWITKMKNWGFEVYYEATRSGEAYGGPPAEIEDYFGSTVLGGHHYERFFLINNLFDVKYAISGNHTTFLPFIKLMDEKKTLVQAESVSEFYRRVFSHFNLEIPKVAVMVEKDSTSTATLELDAFCYPEIYYRHAIGITSEIKESELIKLKEMGVHKICSVYVPHQKVEFLKALGFTVEIVDEITSNDTYRTILTRLAQRWLNKAKGFMVGDSVLVSYWIPWCCRNNVIAVSETGVIDELRTNDTRLEMSKVVFGRQWSEQDILHISKNDYCFQIVDPGRPLFPITEQMKGSFYEPKESYFDMEPSDDKLELYAKENKILSSILFWCPDLRHVECLYRIFDLISMTNAKIGVGITAYHYQYNFYPLQLINVPIQSGGVYPNVEPLLCSCGLGVASEAEGFMSYETLSSNLKKAKEMILEVTSEKFLPKGCYPFLDIKTSTHSNFLMRHLFHRKAVKPSNEINTKFMEALVKNGFEYVVSLANIGEPKIAFRKGDFLAINYTAGRWTGVSPYVAINSVEDIKLTEKKIVSLRRPGWILCAIDSPLWLFSKPIWRYGHKLWEIINYIIAGGVSKNLVNVTPHVIARYARILDDKGLL